MRLERRLGERVVQDEPKRYSNAYKRFVVLLLMTAYTFNAMDRNIISIIASSMKLDLKLSDTQVGLLGGTAFALLYAFGGVPIARLAERVSRVNIIAVALIIWSALSALCGAAASFSQLLLIRVGVGVAEAGCSPPAHSLISDYFEPSRRSTALSIYTGGISLGYLLAAVAGGYAAQHWGWRAACAMVGLPGIAIAVLIKVFIREPPRGFSEPMAANRDRPALPRFSLRGEWCELRAVGRTLLLDRPVLHMVLGVTIGAFGAYGFYAFVPPYFRRVFDLDYGRIGIIAGLAGGVAVGMGIIAGGFVADAFAKRDARWYALVPAIGGIIAGPFYLLAVLQRDWRTATCLLALAGFFQYASLGPTFGVVQNVVGQRRRATAAALLYICLSVVALGGGPLFTGWAIDRLAEADFRQSAGNASFIFSCPGGAALATAGGAIQSACHSTLARATKQGMLVTLLFFGWASIHYLLASVGIAKALQAAALRNAAVLPTPIAR
jgi:predicted MFS family arabinose efflux permease